MAPCSVNKGADQLLSYSEADLICAFVLRISEMLFFHDAAHYCAFANNKFNWMNRREHKESIHLLVFKYCIAFVVFVLRSVCMATEEYLNIYLIPTLHFDIVLCFLHSHYF